MRELREHSPADFPATIQRIHGLTTEIVDAPDLLLCFAVRDEAGIGLHDGWRVLGNRRLGPNADRDRRILDQWYRATRNQATDPFVRALIRTSGRPRAFLRGDVAQETVWRQGNIDKLLKESGIRNRLVAGVPLAHHAELLLVAYRREAQLPFGPPERDAMAVVAQNLRHAGRTIARAHGLIDARAPLASRERQVLRLLLLGLSELDAAARLGLTIRSLHQYVVAVYQKLGVRSRGELVAHFLAPRFREAALARYARRLEPRELEVLRGLVTGLSEKEIAGGGHLSERAVHHVIGAIYRKTRVRTRAALLAQVLAASVEDAVPQQTDSPCSVRI